MATALLGARLLLALVFGVAGATKLADRRGSRQAMSDLGVPSKLSGLFARLLPMAEILVAAALLPKSTAAGGAIAALALALVFSSVILIKLIQGEAPDCHCFGQLHSQPLSWSLLARTLALTAVAGWVVASAGADPGPSAVAWLVDLSPAEAAMLALAALGVGLIATTVVQLRRLGSRHAALQEKVEAIQTSLDEEFDLLPIQPKMLKPPDDGLPIGARAPTFSLDSLEGPNRVTLAELLGEDRFALLLFASPGCRSCDGLMPIVRFWQVQHAQVLSIGIVGRGEREKIGRSFGRYDCRPILLDRDSSVSRAYSANWSPSAVLIRPDGTIGSHLKLGEEAIRTLVRDFLASGGWEPTRGSPTDGSPSAGDKPQMAIEYSLVRIGDRAPGFALSDLAGVTVTERDLLGQSTLLLFWHPRCIFCRGMAEDLKRWEKERSGETPGLVFLASGDPDEIAAMNKSFGSRTLLDPRFEIAPQMGSRHTPSAVLIDGDGRVASSLAMGDRDVRALIDLPMGGGPGSEDLTRGRR